LLIIDNNKEIALGQLAEQTTKNDKVRELAQMIQKDHGSFVQKLQELTATSATRGARLDSPQGDLAGQPGRAGIAERAGDTADRVGKAAERVGEAIDRARQDLAGREGQDRQRGERDRDPADRRESRELADSTSRQTVAKPVIANLPGSELLQFCQDVAEECLNSARKEAQQQSAEEFDKHFVGGQIIAHKGMLAKLQVGERSASPQLAQLLRDAQGTTKQHLEHAEQLIAELGKGESREGGAVRERGSLRESAIERREGAAERRERQEQ
jgi:predicted outer membrane protein